MGRYLVVESGDILPSQDFLKENTLGHILRCYEHHQESELPPPPMVRKGLNGYIAIDGHNLLAINDLLGRETKVFLAESEDDGLEGSSEGILQRNADLKEKFSQSLAEAEALRKKEIRTIRDLRARYAFLSSKQKALQHYGI
jgi:hypothetical protein